MQGFEGTGELIRLAVRRDRLVVPAWVGVLAVSAVGSAAAVKDLYPTVASRVVAANAVNESPPLVAMFGRIYDPTSVAAIGTLKMTAFGSVGAAVVAGLTAIRHTRTEEETGRAELLGSSVLGRRAMLASAVAMGAIVSVTLGLVTAAGLILVGMPAGGSVAFGAAWCGAGLVFTGAAVVAAQVAKTARSASGLTMALLGVAYLVRAVSDSSPRLAWLSRVTPLGWVHQTRAFAGDRWLSLLPPLGMGALGVAGGWLLADRRDLGAGLLSDRAGPEGAGPRLRSATAVAWRMERRTLFAWSIAFAVIGVVFGGVASNVGSFFSSDQSLDLLRRLGGQGSVIDAYLAVELRVVGIAVAAYGLHVAMRLRAEEEAGHTEALLAAGVSRVRWAGSHLGVAMAATVVLAVTVGVAAGAARAVSTGEVAEMGDVVVAALIQLPAAWVMLGVAVAAFGAAARFEVLGWGALAACFLLGEIGPILRLPDAVIGLSPFDHVPLAPGPAISIAPLLALATGAAVLSIAGIARFDHRDLG